MDKTELGCLRAIVLFNPGGGTASKPSNSWPKQYAGRLAVVLSCWPLLCTFPADAKGLSNSSEVEVLREKVYASLEAYCKQRYPEQQGRWAQRPLAAQQVSALNSDHKVNMYLSCPNSGLQSYCSDFRHCAPLAWSAWSTCSSSSWLVTHLLTLSSWKCLKLPTIFNS